MKLEKLGCIVIILLILFWCFLHFATLILNNKTAKIARENNLELIDDDGDGKADRIIDKGEQ